MRAHIITPLRHSQEQGAFPWEQQQTAMAMCADTCESANNAVCDEGRRTDWGGVPRDGVQVLLPPFPSLPPVPGGSPLPSDTLSAPGTFATASAQQAQMQEGGC